jgi:hypothetical protein
MRERNLEYNLSLVLLHLFKNLNYADILNNYFYPHSGLLVFPYIT